jgi:hypothetical protein
MRLLLNKVIFLEYFIGALTLSSPVMPFEIIRLIIFFICYNIWGLERFNPLNTKNCTFFGMESVNPFQPPKNVAYEGQN